jgi:hypothetical protein
VKKISCALCDWSAPFPGDTVEAKALSTLHVAIDHPVQYEALTGVEAIETIDKHRQAIKTALSWGLL